MRGSGVSDEISVASAPARAKSSGPVLGLLFVERAAL